MLPTTLKFRVVTNPMTRKCEILTGQYRFSNNDHDFCSMITINFVKANPNLILPAIHSPVIPSTIASVVPSGLSSGLPTVLPIQPTASTPKDASVKFTVPPGWTMSASAVSISQDDCF